MDTIQLVTHPHRREILRLVWDTERSASDIASTFDITFGATSQHLGMLRDAGFVSVRRDGTRRYYRADREQLAPFAPMLEAMWGLILDGIVERAEAHDD